MQVTSVIGFCCFKDEKFKLNCLHNDMVECLNVVLYWVSVHFFMYVVVFKTVFSMFIN